LLARIVRAQGKRSAEARLRALEQVRLTALMQRTVGSSSIAIGVIDGPVHAAHPAMDPTGIRGLGSSASCGCTTSVACAHGTFVVGILHARREGLAPAICPGCPVFVRAVFPEEDGRAFPSCEPAELASAVYECVRAGARVLNLSLGLLGTSHAGERALVGALDYAANRGVLVVAAAGNQGSVGGSALTRHPGVLPVVAADTSGRVIGVSNVGASIGRHGLAAPGEEVVSLSPDGGTRAFGGTSAASPFVTGTIALLWSLFPTLPAARIRNAVARATMIRTSIIPPLLDAEAAWEALVRAPSAPVARWHPVRPMV
jgi:subtilisin family serine protease